MTQAAPLELLRQARTRFTQREIAAHVGKDIKTVRRWEKGETPCPAMLTPALHALLHGAPVPVEAQRGNVPHFRFIDLFAGIGGIRMGFEAHGGTCVFTSEWNTFSQKTYRENFGENFGESFAENVADGVARGETPRTGHRLIGDIVSYAAADIPAHDVLLAGFPCQPFSIAGVSKKNALGRPHGFECATQGTLFFDVARIIAARRPAAFLLENVKNLLSHDKGRTFDVILQTLRDELGYEVHYRIVDGAHFTPQHRERIIIVGFREATSFSWDALDLPDDGPRLASVLHKTDGSEPLLPWDGERFFDHRARIVQPKYTLTPKLWTYLQNYAEKHRAAGNGFGFGLAYPDSVTRTLSARYHKDGSEILVHQGARQRPRRLTPRECARLMGFPDTFRIPVSDTQAYRQFGNSVVMPVMREVARIMLPHVTALRSGAAPQSAHVIAAHVAPLAPAGLSAGMPTQTPAQAPTQAPTKTRTGSGAKTRSETPAHAAASALTVTPPPTQAA
ncbi:DNA cytosine methyltransferase [Paraburkholderia jirisanensis]